MIFMNKLRNIILALLMAFTMQVGAVQAASFDCAKAATETEKAICNDFQLSVDDRILAHLYKKHLAWRKGRDAWFTGDAPEVSVESIRENQNNWLKNERDFCGNKIACLRSALDSRIDYLLDYVRLENPRSGSRRSANIFFKKNEKSALRFLGGIVENIDSHNILPSLKPSEKTPFIIGTPALSFYSSTQIVWDQSGEHRNGHILAENDNPSMQLDFGEYSQVDYDGLNKCLKTHRIRDFSWSNDDINENTTARSDHGCITFIWNDGGMTNENGIILPNNESEFVKINTEKYIQSTRKNSFSEDDKLETFLTEAGLVERVYLDEFFKFINLSPDDFSDDIVVSPSRKFILTDFNSRCSARLFDITNKISVIDIVVDYYGECRTYVGFSPDSSLWYMYENNNGNVNIYTVEGRFIGSYSGSEEFINGVQFSENNKSITVQSHTDDGAESKVIIDISGDL